MRFVLKSLLLFFVLIIVSCSSQIQNSTAPKTDEKLVAEFDNEKITSDEFESAFLKVGIPKKENKADSIAEKKKFLELYVNYKMKLKDALNKGLANDPEVKKEYDDYRKSIGSGLLVEKELVSKGTKALYEKRKYELRVSQLYVKYDSTQADLGLSKAEKVMARINAGESFEEMVKQYSEDPTTKDKGGDLYYITAGEVAMPEIENGLYATEAGKICSKVFKTRYGFHILKVTEKNPSVGGANASHIMAAYKSDVDTPPDTAAAKEKILKAQKELKEGAKFEDVAQKYSDDKNSAAKGGVIQTFKRKDIIREFSDVVFKMKPGEVSDIVQTPFGFHIIRLNNFAPYPSFAEQSEEIKKIYNQAAFKEEFADYISKLKTEFAFDYNRSLYSKLSAIKDSCIIGDSLYKAKIADLYKDSSYVKMNNKWIKAGELFDFLAIATDFNGRRYNAEMLNQAFEQHSSTLLLGVKSEQQLKNDPEFEKVMNDYKSGILLFKVSESEVWSKVKIDTVKGKEFWALTKDNYLTKPKVTYKEIFLVDESLKDSVYNALKQGADFNTLAKKSLKPDSEKARTEPVEENPIAKKANELNSIGDISEPVNNNNGWSILVLQGKEDKRIKTFHEAWPEVSSILQEKESKRLEDEYVTKIKGMFNPKVYFENIKQ